MITKKKKKLCFITFALRQGLTQGAKNKISIVGSASLNLAEYASKTEEHFEVKIPLTVSGILVESRPMLSVSSCTNYVRTIKMSALFLLLINFFVRCTH